MRYDRAGVLPLFIKRIIEDEETPEDAISRIRSALPYWSLEALHRGALADRGAYQDRKYQTRLEEFIQHTGEHCEFTQSV